jgi:hypothetical protein
MRPKAENHPRKQNLAKSIPKVSPLKENRAVM